MEQCKDETARSIYSRQKSRGGGVRGGDGKWKRVSTTARSISSRRQKSRGGGGGGRCGDGEWKRMSTMEMVGIGRLPDAILCHILSFLETTYSVRTSVLSKRWRYIWTSVPCIDIEYPRRKCLIDFVDRILRLNTVSCLRRLRLNLSGIYNQHLGEWISGVLKRDIEEVVLMCLENQCIKLARSVFTCKKLVILDVSGRILLDVPSSVYLPSLKIFHLYITEFFDTDSMTSILDGCPVLEELNVKGVEICNVKTLFVRSSSLKRLSLHTSYLNRRIVIDAPNVEQLHLMDNGNPQYDINNLSNLVKVEIYIRQGSGLVELLGKFTNTEYMLISSENMNSLDHQQLDHFPKFHNLAHLIVNTSKPSQRVLPYLLECSPKLVIFDYSVSFFLKARSREQHIQFKAPNCLMLYLEEIKLSGLKGFEYEMEMVRYFLKNAKVLKKLSIQSYVSENKKFEISKKLLTFARGSPNIEIIFG